MAELQLRELSEELQKIGYGMLVTRSQIGLISGSPIKHNSHIQYTGESYFFTTTGTSTARDLDRDRNVLLSFQSQGDALTSSPLFITMEGTAELIHDQSRFSEHWPEDLEKWFSEGVDTPGLLLIKVKADRVRYWRGVDSGVVQLDAN